MLGIHRVGCLSRVSSSADLKKTKVVMASIPAAQTVVLDFQLRGWDHHPPAGDQTCFGSRWGQKEVGPEKEGQ